MKRLALIGAALWLACAPLHSEETTAARNLADILRVAEVSDTELFEMCCFAKGRSGFNHCTEYGVCVNAPEKICTGRGPADGWQMRCDEGDKTSGRLLTGTDVAANGSKSAQEQDLLAGES